MRQAGFIVPEEGEALLDEGESLLKKGINLVIFPEGTRSRDDQPFKFQRGAAHLLLRSGAPLLPLFIYVDPPLLQKGHRWYHVPVRCCEFTLSAEADHVNALAAASPHHFGFTTAELSQALQARQLTTLWERFYEKKRQCQRVGTSRQHFISTSTKESP